MAKPIDLDQLMKYPLRRGSEHCDEKNADPRFLNGVESILEWAQTLPTLTPPNEWISVEQLREMDGEPVWVEDVKHWALIDIEKGGQWDGVPFAIWAENGTKFTYNVESRGLHCYRRPPEGEEDNG